MELEIMDMLEELKPGENFSDSSSFVKEELLDSFDIISLVSMLEEKYSVAIDGLEITPENFDSIDAIINLVNNSKRI